MKCTLQHKSGHIKKFKATSVPRLNEEHKYLDCYNDNLKYYWELFIILPPYGILTATIQYCGGVY